MVNLLGIVALYASILCSLILPALAAQPTALGATPDHVAVINANEMPEKCGTECILASAKLVNCNRNGTCYCDDVTTVPVRDCFVCAVGEGYSESKVNGVFEKIRENCIKYETEAHNLSLSGAVMLSIGVSALAVLGGTFTVLLGVS